MGETTAISWADATLNWWTGCTKVSPACDGCYAEHLMDHRHGRVTWGPHGERVLMKGRLAAIRKLNRMAIARRHSGDPSPFLVFCMSLGDVFDNQVPVAWRCELFDAIRKAQNCVFLLLTKRPGNIVRMSREAGGLPPNCALMCTVCNQPEADSEIPKLLEAKAVLAPLFVGVSMEPLLGAVDLTRLALKLPFSLNALTGRTTMDLVSSFSPDVDVLHVEPRDRQALDWIITGGETDQGAHKARPTDPDLFRSLRDQCRAAGVPFHLKQMTRKGPVPADLQIQERPHAA